MIDGCDGIESIHAVLSSTFCALQVVQMYSISFCNISKWERNFARSFISFITRKPRSDIIYIAGQIASCLCV